MNKLLTIIIPTKNRQPFLDRALLYYAEASITTRIIIADSSNNTLRNDTKNICIKYGDKLDISYFHVLDNTELFAKYDTAADMVSTPYLLTVGDDDFPLKSSLESILLKLEKDSSIAAAFGNRVAITKIKEKISEKKWIKTYPNYSGISIENSDPLDRIRRLPIPNWQQYQNSIIRTHIFKKAIKAVSKFNYTQYSELFFSAMVLVHGTWVKYDSLFVVCHQESKFCKFKDRFLFPNYIGAHGSVLSGISQKEWSDTVSLLCDAVGEEVAVVCSKDSVDMSDRIRKIYFSKVFYFVEYNSCLSNNLIDSNSSAIIAINNIFRKLGKLYWTFILHDKSGGIGEYIKFLFGVSKEFLKGRLIKIIFSSTTDTGIINLFKSIKRVGSLDYETDILLSTSSEYNKEYRIIFDIWKKNPCPQQLKNPYNSK
jgi:glycosyltransferase domain-containing protein